MPEPTIADRVEAARNHLKWSIEWKGERAGINETRRHYTNYFKGIANFKEYRQKLVTNDAAEDVYAAFEEILQRFGEGQTV